MSPLPKGDALALGCDIDASAIGALLAVYPQGLGFSGSFIGRFPSSARDHSLSAVAYLPDSGRVLSFGSGVTAISGQFSNRWVLALNSVPVLDLQPTLPSDLRFEGARRHT